MTRMDRLNSDLTRYFLDTALTTPFSAINGHTELSLQVCVQHGQRDQFINGQAEDDAAVIDNHEVEVTSHM